MQKDLQTTGDPQTTGEIWHNMPKPEPPQAAGPPPLPQISVRTPQQQQLDAALTNAANELALTCITIRKAIPDLIGILVRNLDTTQPIEDA